MQTNQCTKIKCCNPTKLINYSYINSLREKMFLLVLFRDQLDDSGVHCLLILLM